MGVTGEPALRTNHFIQGRLKHPPGDSLQLNPINTTAISCRAQETHNVCLLLHTDKTAQSY